MVARENSFFSLLAQHHVPRWVAEKKPPEAEPGDWSAPTLLRSNG
jgi:hypothetical protein